MDPTRDFLDRYTHRLDRGRPFVVVTIVDAQGSVPQQVGAKMIVTDQGLDFGTVGGGKIEAKAIEEAQAMLREGIDHRFVDWSLKADVGMTCGGRLRLFFERSGDTVWPIVIFGAGHVSQALTRLLLTIPCRVTCVDSREDWLSRLPDGIDRQLVAQPCDYVNKLDERCFVLCMTRGHTSDLPVLQALFASATTFPFVGVIGSRAKAAVLKKELLAAGLDASRLQFHCPVGLDIGSNHPSEIAVSIVAQLLQIRDQ
jgi:xanthine dehydrogenase accessory factor